MGCTDGGKGGRGGKVFQFEFQLAGRPRNASTPERARAARGRQAVGAGEGPSRDASTCRSAVAPATRGLQSGFRAQRPIRISMYIQTYIARLSIALGLVAI